jgi:hypothetical protein
MRSHLTPALQIAGCRRIVEVHQLPYAAAGEVMQAATCDVDGLPHQWKALHSQ